MTEICKCGHFSINHDNTGCHAANEDTIGCKCKKFEAQKIKDLCKKCEHEERVHTKFVHDTGRWKGRYYIKCWGSIYDDCKCKKFEAVSVPQKHDQKGCIDCMVLHSPENCPKCKPQREVCEHGFSNYCQSCYARQWAKDNKEKVLKSMREYREKNPEKVRAWGQAGWKNIVVGICQKCNEKPARDRHHPDYNKPKEVQLVCRKCHWGIHNE